MNPARPEMVPIGNPYYQSLGTDSYQRQEAYRNFVRMEHPYDTLLDQELVRGAF